MVLCFWGQPAFPWGLWMLASAELRMLGIVADLWATDVVAPYLLLLLLLLLPAVALDTHQTMLPFCIPFLCMNCCLSVSFCCITHLHRVKG
mgnify:CR=1 FL=1